MNKRPLPSHAAPKTGRSGNVQNEESASEDRFFLMKVMEAANIAMTLGCVSVERIAKEMHLTEQSFRRRLRKYADSTPKAFLTTIQMKRAEKLLTERPEMPVSRVAVLCGFENSSSFCHKFRKLYGCSPSRFRTE